MRAFLVAAFAGLLLVPGAAQAAHAREQTLGAYLMSCKGKAREGACVRSLIRQIEDAREAGEICPSAQAMMRGREALSALAWMRDATGEDSNIARYSIDEATQLAFHALWTCRRG